MRGRHTIENTLTYSWYLPMDAEASQNLLQIGAVCCETLCDGVCATGPVPTNKHWRIVFMVGIQDMTVKPAAAAIRDCRRSKLQNSVAPNSKAKATCRVSKERQSVGTP